MPNLTGYNSPTRYLRRGRGRGRDRGSGRGRLPFLPERATNQRQSKIIQSIELEGLNKITVPGTLNCWKRPTYCAIIVLATRFLVIKELTAYEKQFRAVPEALYPLPWFGFDICVRPGSTSALKAYQS